MSTTRLFYAIVFLALTFISSCKAQCVSSSCGHIQEIKFPFRLRTDPPGCGERGYELECHNNQTVFNFNSRKFNVQEINYPSFSIRLLDPALKDQQNRNCSVFPDHSARFGAFTSEIFQWLPVDNDINYVTCVAPINSLRYIPTSFCSTPNSNSSSYLVIGEILQASDLEEGCRVETVAWSSAPGVSPSNSSSLSSTHQALAHGFELSWRRNILCRTCEAISADCILEESSDIPTCRHFCKEDTPLSQRSLGCKIEYYFVFVFAYRIIGTGGLIAIKFLVGLPILIAVVVWQCKRRNIGTTAHTLSSNEHNC